MKAGVAGRRTEARHVVPELWQCPIGFHVQGKPNMRATRDAAIEGLMVMGKSGE
jgi:hypothetical protein